MKVATFIKGSRKKVFWVIPPVLLMALSYLVRPQDAATISAQTTLAHGGAALALISNSVMTGQLTDTRINGGQPVAATIKTWGKQSRLEFTEGLLSVAHIRNGTMVWEARGAQVNEFTMREPAFRELFYNPSLGLVGTLATAGFAYRSTTTLRGRSVYVLRKTSTYAPQEITWPGFQDAIDLYIDTATNLIAQVDYTYGSEYNRVSFHYDAYQTINNVAVPTVISQWINNATVWQMQVQTVAFNQSLDSRQFLHP